MQNWFRPLRQPPFISRLIEFLFASKTQSSDIPFVTLYNLITSFDIEAQQLRNPSDAGAFIDF